MDNIVKISKLRDKNSDFAYWQSKTYLERLEAIELLRTQYIKFRFNVQPRFIRVCQIINKKLS